MSTNTTTKGDFKSAIIPKRSADSIAWTTSKSEARRYFADRTSVREMTAMAPDLLPDLIAKAELTLKEFKDYDTKYGLEAYKFQYDACVDAQNGKHKYGLPLVVTDTYKQQFTVALKRATVEPETSNSAATDADASPTDMGSNCLESPPPPSSSIVPCK